MGQAASKGVRRLPKAASRTVNHPAQGQGTARETIAVAADAQSPPGSAPAPTEQQIEPQLDPEEFNKLLTQLSKAVVNAPPPPSFVKLDPKLMRKRRTKEEKALLDQGRLEPEKVHQVLELVNEAAKSQQRVDVQQLAARFDVRADVLRSVVAYLRVPLVEHHVDGAMTGHWRDPPAVQ